jgi:hypothetical protein
MPSPRLGVIETVSKAWIDAIHAARAMPVVMGAGALLCTVIAIGVFVVIETVFMNQGRSALQWMASPAGFVFGVLNSSVQIVLLAPLAIAVHRYVILREAARSYPLRPLRPSYLQYVGTALAFNAAYRAPDLINLLLPETSTLPYAVNLAAALVTLALMIAVLIVALRRIALFPAIAVHAPNATWREIPPAGAGNLWRIAIVLIVVGMPGALGVALLHFFLPTPDWPNGTGQLVLSFAMVLVQIPALSALAAAVARIYLAIGTGPGVAVQKFAPLPPRVRRANF